MSENLNTTNTNLEIVDKHVLDNQTTILQTDIVPQQLEQQQRQHKETADRLVEERFSSQNPTLSSQQQFNTQNIQVSIPLDRV
jgi:hypothetical protein